MILFFTPSIVTVPRRIMQLLIYDHVPHPTVYTNTSPENPLGSIAARAITYTPHLRLWWSKRFWVLLHMPLDPVVDFTVDKRYPMFSSR